MQTPRELLADGAVALLAVACFRAAPVAVYVAAFSGLRLRVRVITALCFAALTLAAASSRALDVGLLALGGLQLVVAGCTVPLLASAVRDRRLTPGAAFTLSAALFLVLPAVTLPSVGPGILALGWDVMLSSHSYCVETARSRERPPLGACLFFLFVNPCLVYANRGVRSAEPGLDPIALRRIARGLLCVFVSLTVLTVLALELREAASRTAWPTALLLFAFGAARLATLYTAHTGLADLQIGMMSVLGYRLPERYDAPWRAASPAEFWSRWNTYVREWLERYVYWPVALRVARTRRVPASAQRGLAVFATFAASGLLHDVARYVSAFSLEGRATQAFLACAGLLLLWPFPGSTGLGPARARAGGLELVAWWGTACALLGWAGWQ